MYINVLPELSAKGIDKTFTYSVPTNLIKDIEIGKRVKVSFGNKNIEGFITGISDKKPDYETKDILEVVDEKPVLNKEMLELGKFMVDKYLCYKTSAYQVMLPTALKAKNSKNINKKYEILLKLNKDVKGSNDTQNEIIELLKKNKKMKKRELTNISASSVKTLLNKEIIKEIREESYRLNNDYEEYKKLKLTKDQIEVFNKVKESLNKPATFLLHGITGSGKTEVYMQLIEEVLTNGKEAIVLVPEISLTEQMINRFIGRFGQAVAVLHSGLSDGEKYDEWRKIVRKEVKIVVGARSAIFAPLENLGIIIVDEEHEDAYKQENNPKYHARDIALWRSKRYSCPLILGSATPTLESYARAKQNVYTLLTLDKRAGDAELPTIDIISMKEEYEKGNRSIFSNKLKELISDRLGKKEQIILFLNRRGYSNFISCRECGHVETCPNCDISLTYHKGKNVMRCHYCGYTNKKIDICPECKSKEINAFGYGTEKIEEEIKSMFNAKVIRMDRDTTSRKGSHKKIIDDFKNHKYDILLGTQMIAKGLDFPLVTLVGVLNADTSLNIPDFRSSEKTYQLLMQVSGRAGRSNKAGEVVIQTFNPDHYSIEESKKSKYEDFYIKEMDIRRKLGYSPYYFMISIKVLSRDYNEALNSSKKIANMLKQNVEKNTTVLGPTISNVYKINNVYRFGIIIKHKNDKKINEALKNIIEHYKSNNKVNIEVDIDPIRM